MLNAAQMSWETTYHNDDDYVAAGDDAVVARPAAASSLSVSTKLVRGSPERVCALGDACWPRLSTIHVGKYNHAIPPSPPTLGLCSCEAADWRL
jgi:hypothetical protein